MNSGPEENGSFLEYLFAFSLKATQSTFSPENNSTPPLSSPLLQSCLIPEPSPNHFFPCHCPHSTPESCTVEMRQVISELHLVGKSSAVCGDKRHFGNICDYCCIRSKPRIRQNPLTSVSAKCLLRWPFRDALEDAQRRRSNYIFPIQDTLSIQQLLIR